MAKLWSRFVMLLASMPYLLLIFVVVVLEKVNEYYLPALCERVADWYKQHLLKAGWYDRVWKWLNWLNERL